MRVSTCITAMATMMVCAGASLRGQGSVVAAAVPSGAPTPVLRMNVYTQAVPAFECTPDEGCALSALVVIRSFPMPDDVVLFDSTDQAAHVDNVLRRSDESWRFQIDDGDQRLEFTFSLDSIRFVYGYDPRRDFGRTGRNVWQRGQMYARAEIRDPDVLSALRRAGSLRVLALAPSARSTVEQMFWLRDTTRWLRRLQRAEQSLTSESAPIPVDRRTAEAGQP